MTKLHPRIRAIILALCRAENYIPLAEIARQIGVSAKTVLREMAEVEQILHTYGYSTERKTGRGILLPISSEKKRALMQQIETQASQAVYSQKERLTALAGQLLQNQAPVKLFEFASRLKVAESTISNDLDKLESWFARHGLTLLRKPGLGVCLQGLENDIRKAIVHYIYENISEQDLLGIFHDHFSKSIKEDCTLAVDASRRLLNLMDKNAIDKLGQALKQAEEMIEYKFSDSTYVGLTVHLALGLERIKKAEKIDIAPEFLTELKARHEYKIAKIIAAKVAEAFDIEIPEAETGYITMHLIGARNQYSERNKNKKVIDNFQLVQLTRQLLKTAGNETGLPLADNEKLFIDLIHHLAPSISRLKMRLDIRNPLLNEMKRQYPALMKISKKSAAALEDALGFSLPEAEIAYIAMHIGAAVETSNENRKICTAAIACPTGMGTSKLLAARIQKKYPQIRIAAVISALQADKTKLRQNGIDLIISTVPIQIDFPVVVVNSLLLEKDQQILDDVLKTQAYNVPLSPVSLQENTQPFVQRLQETTSYGESVVKLLKNFFVLDNIDATDLSTFIAEVVRPLALEESSRSELIQALSQRETQGSTIISGQGLLFLHCRSAAANSLYFGIARLRREFLAFNASGIQEKILGAVVMLAPNNLTPQALDTMGYLSSLLVEDLEFPELLRTAEKEFLQLIFTNKLQAFYKEKTIALMED